ncbi:MAG: hypothetical protein V3R78_12595 [Thermodesulfobacteriota bacterium]
MIKDASQFFIRDHVLSINDKVLITKYLFADNNPTPFLLDADASKRQNLVELYGHRDPLDALADARI